MSRSFSAPPSDWQCSASACCPAAWRTLSTPRRQTMLRMAIRRILMIGVLVLSAAGTLASQERPELPFCAGARASLSAASLPRADDESWRQVRACGPAGGAALAAAVGKLGAVSDTALLGAALRSIAIFQDASVLEALRSLAADASATPVARAAALQGMVLYRHPAHGLFPLATVGSSGAGACLGSSIYGRPALVVGTPLPRDFRTRIGTTARTLMDDEGTDALVRAAASCVVLQLGADATPPIDPTKIQLTYVAGTSIAPRTDGDFVGWLLTIGRTVCTREKKKRQRERAVPLSDEIRDSADAPHVSERRAHARDANARRVHRIITGSFSHSSFPLIALTIPWW